MADNYVKFMRGTTSAYNNLQEKDVNTLYFLSDSDDKEGALYLGTKLIAGPDDCSGIHSLKDLSDVLISQDINYDAILMYDHAAQKWQDYSIDALIFSAGTENADGTAGFVPAPKATDTNKFLRGDGTWAIAGTECQIFNIKITDGQSHSSVLALHTADKILNKGDIAIIQDLIIDNKYQYTSYVYDGSNWCALDDKYNANNVYLSTDLVFKDKNNADQTLIVSGKNLKEAFELVLARTETSILSDSKTLTLDNNILSLKDFGKRFYKYVPAQDDTAAKYELQIVDAEHPWTVGLEPKVTDEDGVLVLGWYEPNPTTIEGINTTIIAIQSDINNLTTTTNNLSTKINDYYTKKEVEEKIAAAPHLKRKKVDSIEDIDVTAPDAEQYIYMVPTGFIAEDNKYYEYIIIETDGEKKIERVGSWEVDLSDYVTNDDMNTAHTAINNSILALDQKINEVAENSGDINVINSVSSSFSIDNDNNKQLKLVSVPADINLSSNTSLINTFVQQSSNKSLVDNTEIDKLTTVEREAEKNKINAVSTEFGIDEIDRCLSIVSVDGSKISNLGNNDTFKSMQTTVNATSQNVNNINNELNSINAAITSIHNNYLLKSKYNEDMLEVWDRLAWHEL